MDLVNLHQTEAKSCPICSSNLVNTVFEKHIPNSSNEDFHYQLGICQTCQFVFQLSAYTKKYDQLTTTFYRTEKKKIFTSNFPERTKDRLFIQDLLPKYTQAPVEQILEIGSARGDLLFMMQEKFPNAKIQGIEPSNIESKVPTIKQFFDKKIFNTHFDIIILQQVFEHLKDPIAYLKDLLSLLSQNGLIFIEVPSLINQLNFHADDFSFEHVSYYTQSSMFNLVSRTNASIRHIDESNFLNCIISKKTQKEVLPKTIPDIEKSITQYIQKRTSLLKQLTIQCQNKTIIFYGMGYYFKNLYAEIKPYLKNIKSLAFIDDNFEASCQKYNGIDRVQEIYPDSWVIISSGNYLVKQQILKQLMSQKLNKIKILVPWREIIAINSIN